MSSHEINKFVLKGAVCPQHDLQELGPIAGHLTFAVKSKSMDDDVRAGFAPLH